MFRVQAPNAEQLVESDFSRTGGAADLGSATAVFANFVGSSGSCNRDHILQGTLRYFHEYNAWLPKN
jgi:hypothetical protein